MKLSDDFVKKAEYYLYNIDKVKEFSEGRPRDRVDSIAQVN